MNRVIILGLILLSFSSQLLVAADQKVHPIIEQYLRGLNGLPKNKPFEEARSNLHLYQKLSEIRDGKTIPGRTGNSQNFILDSNVYLLLVDGSAILGRKNLVWMTTESLRAPLRISNSFTVFGSSNVTDVLGVPLISYEWSNERKDKKYVRLFLSPRPDEKDLAYQYIDLEADAKTLDIHKLTFLGTNRKPIKEMLFGEYKIINGNYRYPTVLIRDLLFGKPGELTRISYTKIKPMNVPSATFRPNQTTLAGFIRQYKIKKD